MVIFLSFSSASLALWQVLEGGGGIKGCQRECEDGGAKTEEGRRQFAQGQREGSGGGKLRGSREAPFPHSTSLSHTGKVFGRKNK